MVAEATPLLEALRRAPGMADVGEAEIIQVVELLVYIVLAATRGMHWEGELVFYVRDNSNTVAWLQSRKATNAAAQHLLRILVRAEARWNFTTVGLFVRRTIIPGQMT